MALGLGQGKYKRHRTSVVPESYVSAQERGDLPKGHSGHLEGLRMAKPGQLEQRVIVLDYALWSKKGQLFLTDEFQLIPIKAKREIEYHH